MLTGMSFLVGTSQFAIVGILATVAASVGVSISAAGQLITVFALSNAMGTPLVILATAKTDRRQQLLLALTIILVGCGLMAIPGFGFLLMAYVVLGIGAGVFVVTAYATAATLAPPGRQGRAMSNVSLGFSASLVFGVPIGRVVAAAYDWQVIFWAIGLLTLLSLFAVARVIPAMSVEGPVPLGKQLALLKNPNIALALAVTLFVFIAYSMMNTYITPFLTHVVMIGKGQISVVLFALGMASLMGSKLGGVLSDRIGTRRTLLSDMVIHALVLVLLSIMAGTRVAAIPLLMLWATAAWTFGPTQNFNLLSLAPEVSGMVLSLNSSFVQLGFAMGAAVGGIAVGSSIRAISWLGAVSVAVAFGIACIAFSRARTSQSRTPR
ncbi:MFS transporter [Sulfobacillus sp. DSM 109850]|uniref:MFS transporter n=2 Tax=Sulfobacillus harzensis TaxID=2729629 RepID=A0A7Y0L489_9FIRM|nr:MFS transporter [Sulfobacillus harzensis]NMP21594.1 MFS transporter [Sulfobacillus harzensis]